MQRYSAFQLFKQALTGNTGWQKAWRDPAPKARYDAIIIGGGGHGLATAYYLAKNHGMANVAVLEKGWLGGGNTGRNTTLIRSNYITPGNTEFFDHSMTLWQGLSRDLNYNCMISHRGQFVLAHSPEQMDIYRHRANVMKGQGIDVELVGLADLSRRIPELDTSASARFPVHGAIFQPLAGSVRHDAVAWGYARAADARGVDIIQQCEVTGITRAVDGRVTGVETTRGPIKSDRVGIAVAGNTSEVCRLVGLRLPLESHCLTAYVSEPLKPVLDHVVTFGAGLMYVSQSNKGGLVFGGAIEGYNSYAQRGNLPRVQNVVTDLLAMFPNLPRVKLLRSWGGIQDMTMDGSPLMGTTPIPGLFLNGGWCYQGFKATPAAGWCFAHTLATGTPHPLIECFGLNRFETGHILEEYPQGPEPMLH